MSITYRLESWDDYYRDCQDLWLEHYDEIAVTKEKMPMKPDIHVYKVMEEQGKLQIVVVRDDGIMIGYLLTFIRPHLHYADVLCGFEDAYFLKKTYRRGGCGIKMIQEGIRHMKNVGCKKVFFMTKANPALDMSKLFEHLDFTRSDILYSKWIGD